MNNFNFNGFKRFLFRKLAIISKRFGSYSIISVFGYPRRSSGPVLLVSMPRSGSTWIGRVISMNPKVHYNFEPFNPDYSTVVSKHHKLRSQMDDYPLITDYGRSIQNQKPFFWLSVAFQPPWNYLRSELLFVKDVHALLSWPLVAGFFDKQLFLIRNPYRVAVSHVRRNLKPDLEVFLTTPVDDFKEVQLRLRDALNNKAANNIYWVCT